MNEQQLAAVKQAVESMTDADRLLEDEGYGRAYQQDAITALRSIISQDALYKMAEDAITIGLSYNDWPKIGCVNHDCDKCSKAVGEIKTEVKEDGNGSFTITDAHSTADVVRWLLTQDTKETILCLIDEESQPAPVHGPKFWYDEEMGELYSPGDDRPDGCTPLYDTPPAQPAVSLTDEQIDKLNCVYPLWDDGESCTIMGIKEFTRAIEAAHGIAAAPEKGGAA
jgi:hypothetical protein